jgi:hypothetical protein
MVLYHVTFNKKALGPIYNALQERALEQEITVQDLIRGYFYSYLNYPGDPHNELYNEIDERRSRGLFLQATLDMQYLQDYFADHIFYTRESWRHAERRIFLNGVLPCLV